MTRRFELLTSLEEPILLPGEKICFLRTVKEIPDCFTEEEWKETKRKHFIHVVYFHGFSKKRITAEFGAGIDITIPEIVNWMVDYRYSEFWCQPVFGETLPEVPDETQGSIYVSDQLERSNRHILMPLILEDGRVLRCDKSAMPIKECIVENPLYSGKIFKLQNICNGSGIIAVFDLNHKNNGVHGFISPSDVNGIEGNEFVVYEHFSKEYHIITKKEKIEITLKDSKDYKLYIIVPIIDDFAVIGRTDKFISSKTVKSVKGRSVELWEDGECAVVENGQLKIINSLKF